MSMYFIAFEKVMRHFPWDFNPLLHCIAITLRETRLPSMQLSITFTSPLSEVFADSRDLSKTIGITLTPPLLHSPPYRADGRTDRQTYP